MHNGIFFIYYYESLSYDKFVDQDNNNNN